MAIPYKEFIKKLASRIPKARDVVVSDTTQKSLFPSLEKEKVSLQKAANRQLQKKLQPSIVVQKDTSNYRAFGAPKSVKEIRLRFIANGNYIGRLAMTLFSGHSDYLKYEIGNHIGSRIARLEIGGNALQSLFRYANKKTAYVYHIDSLSIEEEARGSASYKAIMKGLAAIVKKKPALVYFEIAPDRISKERALIRWYRSLGFTIVNDPEGFYGWQIFT